MSDFVNGVGSLRGGVPRNMGAAIDLAILALQSERDQKVSGGSDSTAMNVDERAAGPMNSAGPSSSESARSGATTSRRRTSRPPSSGQIAFNVSRDGTSLPSKMRLSRHIERGEGVSTLVASPPALRFSLPHCEARIQRVRSKLTPGSSRSLWTRPTGPADLTVEKRRLKRPDHSCQDPVFSRFHRICSPTVSIFLDCRFRRRLH